MDMGAYDIPSYEWGPASSPIIWNDLALLQCDTQADSFMLALDARTGKTVWKTERDASVVGDADDRERGRGPAARDEWLQFHSRA